MARTNPKPLRIHVIGDELFHSAGVTKLKEKGHYVENGMIVTAVDVVIGPQCWRIDPKLKLGDDSTEEESLERQLEMMEKGIRAIKYPKEKKNATND